MSVSTPQLSHFLIKLLQEIEHPLRTKTVEAPPHKKGNVRLLNVQKCCCLPLREFTVLQNCKHLKPNLGPCVKLFCIFQSKVSKNIPTSFVYFNLFFVH